MTATEYSVIDFYSGRRVSVVTLEAGVRDVVCQLIDLGATPVASCDGHGHPSEWYVLFSAPLSIAQVVVNRGWLQLELAWTRAAGTFPPWALDHKDPLWMLSHPRRGPRLTQKILREAVRGWLGLPRGEPYVDIGREAGALGQQPGENR